MSQLKPKAGKVFIGQKHKRGVRGDRSAKREDCLCVDVTTASRLQLGPQKRTAAVFSPMRLGPYVDTQSGLVASNLEDGWQGGKMWPTAGHIGADGQPTEAWFTFRRKVYASGKAKRRPLPKRRYGLPTSSFYEGRVHGYVESRKAIYVPRYAALVRQLPEFEYLKRAVDEGTEVLILDKDAPDKTAWPGGREMTPATWDEDINDASRPFGHGYVVAALLRGDIRMEPVTE